MLAGEEGAAPERARPRAPICEVGVREGHGPSKGASEGRRGGSLGEGRAVSASEKGAAPTKARPRAGIGHLTVSEEDGSWRRGSSPKAGRDRGQKLEGFC